MSASSNSPDLVIPRERIIYRDYIDERQLPEIQALVATDLSEPYSVFTYRYFLHNWPNLCILAYDVLGENSTLVGLIISKAEIEMDTLKGYIGMLVVDKRYRKLGIGSALVVSSIKRMVDVGCEEIFLETEVCLFLIYLFGHHLALM
jgi:peptide alpha-N-acetyltransferase